MAGDLIDVGHAAAILRRWCSGAQVSEADLAAARCVISPEKSPVRAKHPLARPQSYYARLYGASVRSIKRWRKIGTENGNPPPLDDPVAMPGWWSENMKQRVPEKLLKCAKKSAPASRSVEKKSASNQTAKPIDDMVTGYAAALDRARENERLAGEKLAEALRLDPPDEGTITLRQRAWNSAFESLRKAEKDATPVLLASGDLVRWSEKETELIEKLSAIHQGVRSIPVRVATKLGITGDQFSTMTELWHAELDKCFAQLRDADFAPGDDFALEAA